MEDFDDLVTKLAAITAEGPNSERAFDIFNMAAYFAPSTAIRIGVFSPIIPDRSELKTAISLLRRLGLVQCPRENAFLVPEDTAAMLRRYIDCMDAVSGCCAKEGILIRAISTLHRELRARLSDYTHCVSLYRHAKGHPRVLEELGELPGVVVLGMMKAGKPQEAVKFGREGDQHLTKVLGDNHGTVLNLECALGLALKVVGKREEAVDLLTTAYGKACRVGSDVVETAMNALAEVLCKGSLPDERRLRGILFPGCRVPDESNSDSELKKWLEYASVLLKIDLTAEGLSILDGVIRRGTEILGRGDVMFRVFTAMEIKALALAATSGKHLEAMKLLNDVYEKQRMIFGPLNGAALHTKSLIGKVLLMKGDLEEAMTMFEDVVSNIKQTDPFSIEVYEKTMAEMIEICILKEDLLKALQLSRDLLDVLASVYGSIHPKCFQYRKRRSDILLKLNQPEKAVEVLKRLSEDYKYELDEEELVAFSAEIRQVEKNIRSFDAPPGTLHSFAKEGDVEKVLSLIESGEDVDSKDSANLLTPLHYASAFGQVEVARALIGKGAKTPSEVPLKVVKGEEMTSLFRTVRSFFAAVKANDIDLIVGIASREPCMLRAKDDQGCTPLHWAALRGFGGTLRLLLEFGSDPTAVSDKGNSPIHIAASKGHSVIAETLLRSLGGSAEVTAALDGRTGIGGNTPLHAAAEKGHVETVRSLLGHGAVCAVKNAAGKTPLQVSEDWACKNILGLVEGLFLDVSNGDVGAACAKLRDVESGNVLAVSRARNGDHRTLLQEAMEQKNVGLAKKLVKLLKYDS